MTVVGKEHLDGSDASINALIVIGPIFLALGALAILGSGVALAIYVCIKDSELTTHYASEAPPLPPPIDRDMLPPSNEDSDQAFQALGEFSPGALPDTNIQGPLTSDDSLNPGPFDLGNSMDMQPSQRVYSYGDDPTFQKY